MFSTDKLELPDFCNYLRDACEFHVMRDGFNKSVMRMDSSQLEAANLDFLRELKAKKR